MIRTLNLNIFQPAITSYSVLLPLNCNSPMPPAHTRQHVTTYFRDATAL